MGTVPGRFSGHYTPPIPGQLAIVGVLDDTANRLIAYRPLPFGEARTTETWDAVLRDLGYRRTSEWQRFGDEGHRCDLEPASAVADVEGGDNR